MLFSPIVRNCTPVVAKGSAVVLRLPFINKSCARFHTELNNKFRRCVWKTKKAGVGKIWAEANQGLKGRTMKVSPATFTR